MKTNFRLLSMAFAMMFVACAGFVFTACGDDNKEEEMDKNLYVRPWQEYPQSYIKFFDYRMQFRLLNVQRNGSALQIDYVLTNVGFGQEIACVFYLDKEAGHDDLGNTYRCEASQSYSDIVAMINGSTYSTYGNGKQVNFMPNQAIRGSFTIKNFDINAVAFSMSCHVQLAQPQSGIALAYDRIDFVNIPIDTYDEDDSYDEI